MVLVLVILVTFVFVFFFSARPHVGFGNSLSLVVDLEGNNLWLCGRFFHYLPFIISIAPLTFSRPANLYDLKP